jgi:hypothetical protein
MLASVFHLFTDHMPEQFKKLPRWLQKQMRQAMFDCGIDADALSKKDIKDCREYGQWLENEHPQPRRKVTKK